MESIGRNFTRTKPFNTPDEQLRWSHWTDVKELKPADFPRYQRFRNAFWKALGYQSELAPLREDAAKGKNLLYIYADYLYNREIPGNTLAEFARHATPDQVARVIHSVQNEVKRDNGIPNLRANLEEYLHQLKSHLDQVDPTRQSLKGHPLLELEAQFTEKVAFLKGLEKVGEQRVVHHGSTLIPHLQGNPSRAGSIFIEESEKALVHLANGTATPRQLYHLWQMCSREGLFQLLAREGQTAGELQLEVQQALISLQKTPGLALAMEPFAYHYDKLMERALGTELAKERTGHLSLELDRRLTLFSEVDAVSGTISAFVPDAILYQRENAIKRLKRNLEAAALAGASPERLRQLYLDQLNTEIAVLERLALQPAYRTEIKHSLAALYLLNSPAGFATVTRGLPKGRIAPYASSLGTRRREAKIEKLLKGVATTEGERRAISLLFEKVGDPKIRAQHLQHLANSQERDHNNFWNELYRLQVEGKLTPVALEGQIKMAKFAKVQDPGILKSLAVESLRTHYSEEIALAYAISGHRFSDFLKMLDERGEVSDAYFLKMRITDRLGTATTTRDTGLLYQEMVEKASLFPRATFAKFLNIEPELKLLPTAVLAKKDRRAIIKQVRERASQTLTHELPQRLSLELKGVDSAKRADRVADILLDYATSVEANAATSPIERASALLKLDPSMLSKALDFAGLNREEKEAVIHKTEGAIQYVATQLAKGARSPAPTVDRADLLNRGPKIVEEWIETEETFAKQIAFLVQAGEAREVRDLLKDHSLDEKALNTAFERASKLHKAISPFQNEVAKIKKVEDPGARAAQLLQLLSSSSFAAYAKGIAEYAGHQAEDAKILAQADKLCEQLLGEKRPLQSTDKSLTLGLNSSLRSLAITAVQRLPRHVLLAKDLLKELPQEHALRSLASTAVRSAEKGGEMTNEQVRLSEAFTK
ncbi:MAG: RhoGEF domain-containing protein [Parachlamydiales bacterium]